MITTYFVRLKPNQLFREFTNYCELHHINYRFISSDWIQHGLSYMYSVDMDKQEALRMKLAVEMLGMMAQPVDLEPLL